MYRKIDKWWINEIEIPISGNEIPDDYDMEKRNYEQAKHEKFTEICSMS